MKQNAIKVLMIEDNSGDARLIEELLGSKAANRAATVVYDFVHAGRLSEAMQVLRAGSFDVVLLDLSLPDSSGMHTVEQVLKTAPRCPVVVLSGLKDEELAIEAMQQGAQDYLVKGHVDGDLLSRSIRYAIERKSVETALEVNLNFMQGLLDTIPSPIVHKDLNGVYRSCNKAFEKFRGFSREQIIGKTAYDIFPREMADKYHESDLALIRAPGTVSSETSVQYADGSQREVIVNKATVLSSDKLPVGIVAVFIDISEHKRAEEERSRLASAIEQADESVVITDSNGLIQYVNPAFERITGYRRDEVIGQTPRLLKSGKQNDHFYRELWNTIKGGLVWKGHFENRRKDGTLYREDASITPVRDASGAIINYVAVKRDVTNEVRLEKQLRQAQKLEAIGTLAGGIAHDFNNILGIIMGFTELVLYENSVTAKMRETLDHVLRATHRAKDLVRQILAFSRQGEQERKPVFVSSIVQEALKMLRSTIPSTIEILDEVASVTSMVMADPTQMHQILMNLCTNAAHAMREKGGVLEVVLSEVELDEAFKERYAGLMPGRYLRLTVSDTGHGMEPAVLERIFDPYFTTKDASEGTGLGLAVVHGIVQSHRGEIFVYSTPGKGSAFNVFLPVIEAPSQDRAPSDMNTPVPIGHERILLVDDEVLMVEMGQQMLERLGYEVVVRTSSIEALEAFRAQPGRFDLLITDQTMPHMTGEALAKEILSIRPDTPIIVCTGFSERLPQEKAKTLGFRAFLMKPVLLKDLGETVRRVLDAR